MSGPRDFARLGGETVYHGGLVEVRIERFRHDDGEEVAREVVRHPGAVGILAHDDKHVWLVRQPREVVGESDLLEIPAGRLDVDGEPPEQAARRELSEEIGRGAHSWERILTYYSSSGFTDERVHLFHATDLYEDASESGEVERIELVSWPLTRLREAIEQCADAKTLIALQWLALRLGRM